IGQPHLVAIEVAHGRPVLGEKPDVDARLGQMDHGSAILTNMSEPRVPMLSTNEALTAAEAVDVPSAMATLSVYRVLLRHPPLAQALTGLLQVLLFRGKLDARLRELIIMRIGWA